MFVKIHGQNYSNQGDSNVLEKHNDVFKNELTIKSLHNYYRGKGISIHNEIPVDIIYKSSPGKERVYLSFWGNASSDLMILNIDGVDNIELSKSREISERFDDEEWIAAAGGDESYGLYIVRQANELFYNNRFTPIRRVYFELKKDQLYKLCIASSLSVQVSTNTGDVQFERSITDFIVILQALYNEAFDSTKFCEAKDTALSFLNNNVGILEEEKRKTDKKDKREDVFQKVYFIIMGIVFIGLIIWGINALS